MYSPLSSRRSGVQRKRTQKARYIYLCFFDSLDNAPLQLPEDYRGHKTIWGSSCVTNIDVLFEVRFIMCCVGVSDDIFRHGPGFGERENVGFSVGLFSSLPFLLAELSASLGRIRMGIS